ncbi:mucin-5AC-like [Planoprotostelium fungivorum]|uniref:Mucin-5AC-like n=1 Tax=Planoprotostelium fungivorum TaxID=1890364 RepID=A0A2P6NJ71_9EUKA|nr:mucin-5AC-like [Planoprotostelium fungivorum]
MDEHIRSLKTACNASAHTLSRLSSSGGSNVYDEYIDVLRYAAEVDGQRVTDVKGIMELKERAVSFHDLLAEDESIIRFISNPRLRKTYDIHVSNLFKCAHRLLNYQTEGIVARVFGQQEAGGRAFWEDNFRDNFMVRFDAFCKRLEVLTKVALDSEEVKQLQYVTDYNQTGCISVHRFATMLNAFGPLTQCLHNINDLFSKHYFYGYMTQREAEELLSDEPSSFLVRFDLSRCDCVVISSNVTGSVKHYAVSFVASQRRVAVWSEEEGRVVERESIGQFVTESNLGRPYISDIPRMKCFYGDVLTHEVLAGKPDGTYLLRLSSKRGFYAVSFLISNGALQHRLVEKKSDVAQLEEEIKKQAEAAIIPMTASSIVTRRRTASGAEPKSVYVDTRHTPIPHPTPVRRAATTEDTPPPTPNHPRHSPETFRVAQTTSPLLSKSPPLTETPSIASVYIRTVIPNRPMSPPKLELEKSGGSFVSPTGQVTYITAETIRQRITGNVSPRREIASWSPNEAQRQMQGAGGSFIRAQPQSLMGMTRRSTDMNPATNVKTEELRSTMVATPSTMPTVPSTMVAAPTVTPTMPSTMPAAGTEIVTPQRMQQLEQKVKELSDSLSATVQSCLDAITQMSTRQMEESVRQREVTAALQDALNQNRMLAQRVEYLEQRMTKGHPYQNVAY